MTSSSSSWTGSSTSNSMAPESDEIAALPAVLATGFLVGIVEWACIRALAGHLDDGEQTLGVHVDLSHEAPTPVGAGSPSRPNWPTWRTGSSRHRHRTLSRPAEQTGHKLTPAARTPCRRTVGSSVLFEPSARAWLSGPSGTGVARTVKYIDVIGVRVTTPGNHHVQRHSRHRQQNLYPSRASYGISPTGSPHCPDRTHRHAADGPLPDRRMAAGLRGCPPRTSRTRRAQYDSGHSIPAADRQGPDANTGSGHPAARGPHCRACITAVDSPNRGRACCTTPTSTDGSMTRMKAPSPNAKNTDTVRAVLAMAVGATIIISQADM